MFLHNVKTLKKIRSLKSWAAILLAALSFSACQTTPQTYSSGELSPWDKNQNEIEHPVTLPVNYPQAFSRERHLFAYAPRFMPGQISFTPENRPVIRFGLQGQEGQHTTAVEGHAFQAKNYIQYLNNKGQWFITESHVDAIRSFLKLDASAELLIQTGNRIAERIEFDAEGHAYTLVTIKSGKLYQTLLLYSSDNMKSWQVMNLPRGNWRIESYQTHNLSPKPPVIVSGSNKQILLIAPQKKHHKLELPTAVDIPAGTQMVFHSLMSGAGNHCITVGDKTFICYLSMLPHPELEGTPQYIVSYNHKTGETATPVFLGVGGHRVDGHNSPVILADYKGHIHVLLGTHWHSMVHCVSKNPADISAWQKPVYVAGNGDNSWSRNGITYPGFTIDKNDTLHLVVRGRNSRWVKNDIGNERISKGYPDVLDYALVYLRKKEDGNWEKRRDLVRPSHMAYSNWYQKIAIDRQGNPYLSYSYYAHNLTQREKQQYVHKWGGNGENKTVTAHDPVLIRTANGGDSWQIVTTPELFSDMK